MAAVVGRLVLRDRVAAGRLTIDGGRIVDVALDPAARTGEDGSEDGPLVAPGFVDVHVHGWDGWAAMDGPDALGGMARGLLRHGVTSFLPTAVSAPLGELARFAEAVRGGADATGPDAAEAVGFNLEGPFLALQRAGAHDRRHLLEPAAVAAGDLVPLLDGLRVMTVAPELPGALELIERLRSRGVVVSLGHSDATFDQAAAAFRAGAAAATHLLNAMSGLDHRRPGLAAAALADASVRVELIADGHHVDAALWPLLWRLAGPDRIMLVSDAVGVPGIGDRRGRLGELEVEIRDDRCTLVEGGALAGSVITLDTAVRNVVAAGVPLPQAVAAASANPAALLGLADRGLIEAGRRADLVELDDDLRVRRVCRGGTWSEGATWSEVAPA